MYRNLRSVHTMSLHTSQPMRVPTPQICTFLVVRTVGLFRDDEHDWFRSADNEDLDAEDELLVSVMVKDMLNHLHRELQGAIAAQGRNELAVLVQWLKITFRGVR